MRNNNNDKDNNNNDNNNNNNNNNMSSSFRNIFFLGAPHSGCFNLHMSECNIQNNSINFLK